MGCGVLQHMPVKMYGQALKRALMEPTTSVNNKCMLAVARQCQETVRNCCICLLKKLAKLAKLAFVSSSPIPCFQRGPLEVTPRCVLQCAPECFAVHLIIS